MSVSQIKDNDFLITKKSYFPFGCALLGNNEDDYRVVVFPGSIISTANRLEFIPIEKPKIFKLKEGEGVFFRVIRTKEEKTETLIFYFPDEEAEGRELNHTFEEITINDIELITKKRDADLPKDSEDFDIELCFIESGNLQHSIFFGLENLEELTNSQFSAFSQNGYQQLYLTLDGQGIFTL